MKPIYSALIMSVLVCCMQMNEAQVNQKQKVALIIGTTGQDGSYLVELLLEKGNAVHGIKRRASSLNTQRLDHLYRDPHERGFAKFALHYGDITDENHGTDIKLTYTKPTRPGAYPQTTLKMNRNTSPLADSRGEIETVLATMPDFDTLFKRHTPEEVEAILDEQMATDTTAENSSKEVSRYGNNSVDAAYNELLAGK